MAIIQPHVLNTVSLSQQKYSGLLLFTNHGSAVQRLQPLRSWEGIPRGRLRQSQSHVHQYKSEQTPLESAEKSLFSLTDCATLALV